MPLDLKKAVTDPFSDIAPIGCMPTSIKEAFVVDGATVRKCECCECDVWASPTTIAALDRKDHDFRIVCTNCLSEAVEAERKANPSEEPKLSILPGQIKEILAHNAKRN